MKTPLLPSFKGKAVNLLEAGWTPEALDQARANEQEWDLVAPSIETWPEVLAILCKRHALTPKWQRFKDGTMPVFQIGDAILKFYCPLFSEDPVTEELSLRQLSKNSLIPGPKILATGLFEGWSYILMSRLPGRSVNELWPELESSSKAALLREVGALLWKTHSLNLDPQCQSMAFDWSAFIHIQRERCVDRQRALGLPEPWLGAIEAYFDSSFDIVAGPIKPALLHTEVWGGSLLAEERQGRWRLSGIFDYGDAFLGPALYDVLAPTLFMAGSERSLLEAFLEGYEQAPWELDEEWASILMLYALLHRYCHLRWYLSINPPPSHIKSFEALARYWFLGQD